MAPKLSKSSMLFLFMSHIHIVSNSGAMRLRFDGASADREPRALTKC